MKLFIVLVLAIILVGPTLAKTFSKQPEPVQKRGVFYRVGRRVGFGKLLVGIVVVLVVLPTALYVMLGR
jgi:hypothetical protein